MNPKCRHGGWCYHCHSFVRSNSWLPLEASLAYSSERRKQCLHNLLPFNAAVTVLKFNEAPLLYEVCWYLAEGTIQKDFRKGRVSAAPSGTLFIAFLSLNSSVSLKVQKARGIQWSCLTTL